MKSGLKFLSFLFVFLILGNEISVAQCGLDIFIANDQSGSVDNIENRQSRMFITELMRNLEPWGTASNQSRMAIAQWDGYNSWQQYNFPDAGQNYTSKLSDVIAFQNSPRILSGWTDPYDALLKTYRVIGQTPAAGRNTNKIIVLMTDADCSQIQQNIVQLATQIKDEGIFIIVLAIDGAYNCPVLKGSNVASPNGYFNAGSYAELQQNTTGFVKSTIAQACNFTPPVPTFDLSIQLNAFNATGCQTDGSGGAYSVNYTIKNEGDISFNNMLKVAFYDADPLFPSAKLLAVQTLNSISIASNSTYLGNITNSNFSRASQLYAVVNVDGTKSPPFSNDLQNFLFIKPEESANNNISNNINIVRDATCLPRSIVNTAVSHTGIACDSTITYSIEFCNTGNAAAWLDDVTLIEPSAFVLKDTSKILENNKRLWATYYGESGSENVYASAVDAQGNIYIAGQTGSTSNIATIGGHQYAFGGGASDAFLVKFDNNGVRQWATYYGGSQGDNANAIAVDAQGNVYMTGNTVSTDNIATIDGHQNTFGGGANDAFLVKFDNNGVRQWATYYGGSQGDLTYAIAVDLQSNIYIAGRTGSTNNIASSDGHQNTFGGSPNDAFLVKFDNNGIRKWATYYGGTSSEDAYCLTTDLENNVYMSGWTSSQNISTAGSHQSTLGGSMDAYLVKFNSSGIRQWATYYGGSNEEASFALAVDAQNNIFMAGRTKSINNIATVSGHQNTIGGQGYFDGFLVKLNSNGIRQWATYYGGEVDDFTFALATDAQGNVYTAGYTRSMNNIATLGKMRNSLMTDTDAFLVNFNTSGVRQWGIYYGAGGGDFARALVVDGMSNIFMAGYTTSVNTIATPGSHQSTFRGVEDAFLVKISPGGLIILPNTCKSFQKTYYIGDAFPGTYNYSVGVIASAQDTVAEAAPIILPDNNFSAGTYTNLNGFNGANHTTDDVVIPANLPAACAPGDKVSTTVSISPNNTCGNNFAQATVSINNTSGVDILNTILELNLTGAGAAFAGEMYNVSSNLSYQVPFVLHPDYPNIPNALYTKTGIVRVPLWKLPAGITTFNIDISLGIPTTNLSVKIDSINSNYNATGQSNTAALSQAITVPVAATISGFSCPASIMTGNNITFSGISTTNASSVKWASSSVTNIPNTGTVTNPAIVYTPTPKDIANGFVAISLTALNSNGCETTRSCQISINNVVYDYGDAPISYDLNKNAQPYAGSATLHSGIYLGTIAPGSENTAKSSANATGDGNEEDGLTSSCGTKPVNLQPYQLTVKATNNSSVVAYISAFIDWNNDGDYLDDGETVLNIVQANNGSGTKDYTLHFRPETANPALNKYFVRLRISTDSNSVRQPYGAAPQGEVEDHLMELGAASTFNNSQSICQGSSYSINGKTYTAAGVYRDTLKNAAVGGCDSIIVTTLTLKSSSTFNNSQIICQGSSYVINGKNYTTAGTYRDTLKNAAVGGCDSIIITNLTVNSSVTFNNPQNICQGSAYAINGKNYTTAGIYRDTLKNAAVGGCDSIIETTLTLKTSSTFNNTQSICQGRSYTINGKTYSTTGIYHDTLKNAALGGCDSIIITNLTVNSSVTSNNPQSICQGSSYSINSKSYTTTGIYNDTLKNAAVGGCDSIIITNLTVNSSVTFNNPQSICQGSSYSINGKNYTTAGTYRDTLKNAAVGGCDSIIITNLTVNSSVTFNNPQSICQGSVYNINGKTYTAAGVYRDTLKNAAVGGCDSIVITNLTVNTSVTYNNPQSICQGGSYVINGKTYAAAGVYRDTLKNAAIGGCDSIIVTTLTLKTSSTFNNPQSICPGSSYSINGKNYTTTGTYRDTLKNAAVGGCDSIIVTNLTIVNTTTTNLTESICTGQSFQVGTQTFTTAGNYVINLKSVGGCDSIVNLNLTVSNTVTTNLTESICTGQSFQVGTQTFTTAGSYTVNLKSVGGCDSIVNLDLIVTNAPETSLNEIICSGSSFTVSNQSFNASGEYNVVLQSVNSCDSIVKLSLTVVEKTTQRTIKDTTVCIQDELMLYVPEGFSEYQWHDGRVSTYYLVTTSGWHWVEMQEGCNIRTDSIYVELEDCSCEVFFPQAFSPNRDGNNDYFRPIEKNITQVNLMIYNRWGERVFDSGHQKNQWDGTFNGAEMPMDTYIYHYYGMCSDGSYKTTTGLVTIIR